VSGTLTAIGRIFNIMNRNNFICGMKLLIYCVLLSCIALFPTSCNTHKSTPIADSNGNKPCIFINPHQMPFYLNGGDDRLRSDLYTALSKTAPVQECIKGRAFVSFSISKDGTIDPNSIKVMRNRSVPEDYMDAAIEAIKSLGKFEPGKLNGIPKKVTYNISIEYPVPLEFIKTSE